MKSKPDLPSLNDKLQQLKYERERAVTENFIELQREGEMLTVPEHVLRKKQKAQEYLEREELAKEGIDFERLKATKYTAHETSEWNKRLEERALRKDTGFASYQEASHKKYSGLFSRMTTAPSDATPSARIDLMAVDIEKQIQARSGHSRRRKFVADEDVTYINQRNYKFNKKIARAYDSYTEKIRENLERGTA